MPTFTPSLSECRSRGGWLNAGEFRVAEALNTLDAGWTIYVQPRLGMEMPDFVALHDDYGVCAIEVKDWAYGKYRNSNGVVEYRRDGGWNAVDQHPRLQAHRYRSNIFEHSFAFPHHQRQLPPSVRSLVILLNHPTKQATDVLRCSRNSPGARGVDVLGEEALDGIEAAVIGRAPARPPEASMQRLRTHLDGATYVSRMSPEIRLSDGAANIAKNPNGASMRRVRGAAGTGKSFGLAARAAALAGEGKSVLVLSFNITLAHYLRALVTQHCPTYGADPTRVSCVHFHGFCSRLADDARQLRLALDVPGNIHWSQQSVAKAASATDQGVNYAYDAILVDEGQDFELDWWTLLRRQLRPGGEMLLVADPTQNIFSKKAWTDEVQMLGSGFSGPWTDLGGSYRLPRDMVPILREFGNTFVRGEVVGPVLPPEDDVRSADTPTRRHWVDVDDAGELAPRLAWLCSYLARQDDIDPSEIVVLCETHRQGLLAVAALEGDHEVHHLFAESRAEQRRRKDRFWPDAPGIKASTIASFKGWESRAVVLGIGNDTMSARLAYVAMTRLQADPEGRPSFIGVVNANPRLRTFGPGFKNGIALPPPRAPGQVA